jgi:predicted DCC family thiol-disulfide oxidoreductase YuxK
MQLPDGKSGTKLTVWFDGACPLCRREMALMRRLDRRRAINFVDLASENIDCPGEKAELIARIHVRENDRLLSGASAFAAVWRAIPLLRPLGLLARIPFLLALLERGYVAFLRHRPRLQRLCARRDGAGFGVSTPFG